MIEGPGETGSAVLALTLIAALVLAAVHALAGRVRVSRVPRSKWLSFAGGSSVAYVFVQLLPELAAGQEALATAAPRALAFLEHHTYLLALGGLAAFYGLERAAIRSRRENVAEGLPDRTGTGVFRLHAIAFGAYNVLIGYILVHREHPGARSLALFALAMALHFLVNDTGLRDHHKELYDRYGRWAPG